MPRSSASWRKTSPGTASKATRPWFKTIRRPQKRAASSMEWVTMTTVTPLSWMPWMSVKSSSRPAGSRPAAGSSSTSVPGFIASTPAMATRRFCPPESSKGDFSRISSPRPTWESASRTRVFTVSSSRPRLRGPKPTSFSTVSSKSWYSGYWNTSPTSRRISMRLWPFSPTSTPPTNTWPGSGRMRALRWAMSVDLPLPVWPMTPTKSPSRMVRETSSSARVSKGVPGI